ncbi:MAG TPA: glycosyltransferase [Gemmataceae bacterium]|nr:glycosyltransferase [Gemmataceae bacterium]
MLDFITLSRDPGKVQQLTDGIEACMHGAGQEWNLQVVDGHQHDLFSGYNAGAEQTDGEILIFIHDDVQLLGNRHALRLPLELLQDPSTGFVGVAGSRTVLTDGGLWCRRETIAETRGMAGHPSPENEFGLHWNVWPHISCAVFGRVAVLDGVMLMCHRRTFDKLGGFAAGCYQGFHFYDIDITFRAALAQLANYAVPFPLFHASVGFPDEEWEANRLIFVSRFGSFLPFTV